MPDGHIPDSHPEQQAPQGLEQSIQALYQPYFGVPGEIDERVLADARRVLHRPGLRFSFRPSVLATAAVLALAASVTFFLWTRHRTVPARVSQTAVAGDLDADGRVDIVDAMVLAASIERHETAPAARDINGDGLVDRSDVDALALMAVRLDGGGT
jgi:hypothetical protein